MIEQADREVCIFTGRADREYQDDFLDAACLFLAASGHHLQLACQCGHEIITCKIIEELAEAAKIGGSRLTVRDANHYSGMPYFMVADGSGYRLELPGQDTTFVDYGDIDRAVAFRHVYDRIAARSPIAVEVG
ncbi:MAG: hypothetical protein OEV73_00310 [Desulfobulbaceae bacterium]|nr:hypothetical protein [Desulfobulbaceae bacterium]